MTDGLAPILTVDVEDWFHVCGHPLYSDPATWAGREKRVHAGVERMLALLDGTGSTATFFILGWIARQSPSLVRRIADAGHEIACHGDLGFGNVVFRERVPIALIDFEFIVRADPLYDVATLASVRPVLPQTPPDDATGRTEFEQCLLAVADGYGLDSKQRQRLPRAMAAVEQNAINFMSHLLDEGDAVAVAGDFATVLPQRAGRLGWLRAAAPHLDGTLRRS